MDTEAPTPAATAIANIDLLILEQKAAAEAVVSDFSARRTAAAEAYFALHRRRQWWNLFIYIRQSAPHLLYLEWARSHAGKGRKIIRTTLRVGKVSGQVRHRDLLQHAKEYEQDLVIETENALRTIRKALADLVKIRAALVRFASGPSAAQLARRRSAVVDDDGLLLGDLLESEASPSPSTAPGARRSAPTERPQLRNRE